MIRADWCDSGLWLGLAWGCSGAITARLSAVPRPRTHCFPLVTSQARPEWRSFAFRRRSRQHPANARCNPPHAGGNQAWKQPALTAHTTIMFALRSAWRQRNNRREPKVVAMKARAYFY